MTSGNDPEAWKSELMQTLKSVFQAVVNQPEKLRVHFSVVPADKNRFSSDTKIVYVVCVDEMDVRLAHGSRNTIYKGIDSWIGAIRGRYRIPIELKIEPHGREHSNE